MQALSKGSPSGREAPPGSRPRESQPRPLLCPFCGQEAVLDVLEVWGYIYKAEYRMRFLYAQMPGTCVLMGQEILEASDPY